MNLVQVDLLKRVPYPPNPDGWYYWTSVYYIDMDLFSGYPELSLYMNIREQLIITEDVQIKGERFHDPPGRGNVVWNRIYLSHTTGELPSEGEFSLINVCRWRLYSETGRPTYRLNRMPLRPSDIDGAQLSDSGYFQQQASLGTFLLPGRFRNAYGELLTSGEVVRPITMWQLRHGTRRRERNPIA